MLYSADSLNGVTQTLFFFSTFYGLFGDLSLSI